ncbi:MAG: hypothetical protein FJ319_14230 [SAR202 cluster bacterium]|nr:hypothetical protein [SAR202 cluster bacterium]
MKWSSAVSEFPTTGDAIAECADQVLRGLDGLAPDLVVAFPSAHHAPEFGNVPELISRRLNAGALIGCSGGGVIGAGREVEHRPGFSLTAAHLPGVEIVHFHLENEDLPTEDAAPDEWEDMLGVKAADRPDFIILADPYTFMTDKLIAGLDYAFAASAKIGGMASGAQQWGGNALYTGGKTHRSGAVGVSLHGEVTVDTIVAQGCRPIGSPMQVTACKQTMLLELEGKRPIDVLKSVYEKLNTNDQRLVTRHSLFLGIVMDPLNDNPMLGDFLIRNILGADHATGGISVDEVLREGQTVQFHLRDADTSSRDLESLLDRYAGRHPAADGAGALLFQCLGRGSYLYGRPDHDTEMFRHKVSPMPLSGFFCNGEIGQVGGATFLHGYTSSFGIFRPRAAV